MDSGIVINDIQALHPVNVEVNGTTLTIWLDEDRALVVELTESVTMNDAAGVSRTGWRWRKQQPGPGATFDDSIDGVDGLNASGSPPTWPAFCIDDGAAAVGDIVRIFPGYHDPRPDMAVNYQMEWYFWSVGGAAGSLDVNSETFQSPGATVHGVNLLTFGPYDAALVEEGIPGQAIVRYNFTSLARPGLISTEPQYLGAGLKNVFELGISPFAFMTDPDNMYKAQVALIHTPPQPGGGYMFSQDLTFVRDWVTGSDTSAFEKATLNCGPLIKLDGSQLHGGAGAWVGCGTTNVNIGRLELYDGSLPGTAWANPAYLATSLNGTVTSSGIMDGGGQSSSSFGLWFTGMRHIGTGQFVDNNYIGGFVPGAQWMSGAAVNQSDENSDIVPWRGGNIFLTDKHVYASTRYKLRTINSPGGTQLLESGVGCLYVGQTAVVAGNSSLGTGMGFVAGIYVGGSPTVSTVYLGDGSGSPPGGFGGGGYGGGSASGTLSTAQGGTGISLTNVPAGSLLVAGANGAPMIPLTSARTGANGKLQFGVDADTWLEYDMSTIP